MNKKILVSSVVASIALVVSIALVSYWMTDIKPYQDLMNKVRGQLASPESANFEGLEYFPALHSGCGYFRSSSDMAGYAGLRGFVVTSTGQVLLAPPLARAGMSEPETAALAQAIPAYLSQLKTYCPSTAKGVVPKGPPALPAKP